MSSFTVLPHIVTASIFGQQRAIKGVSRESGVITNYNDQRSIYDTIKS